MRKNFTFPLLLLAVCLVLSVAKPVIASNIVSVPLVTFRSAEKQDISEALYFFEQRDVVKRFAEIELHGQFKEISALLNIDKVELNLFDDVNYTAQISRSDKNINGSVTFMARLNDVQGYFTMTTTHERTLGGIYLPGLNLYYKITSNPTNNKHYLIEMAASDRDILEGAPSLIPEITEKDLIEQHQIKEHLKSQNLGPDDWANIDVMIMYTPSARQWANNQAGGIENVMAIAMANAQLVLDNSKVKMTMTLVHSEEYNFQESGNSGSDLTVITNSQAIQSLRDQYSADLVALFANVSDVGGLAWLLTTKNGNPAIGYSLTRVQQAADAYTHIHEMGHNMGCHHHKDQNFQPGPTIWQNWPENYYSAGWRWTGNDNGHYCSVMTYTAGAFYEDGVTHTEVPYFSNPDVTHMMVPTGDPFDGDNARTLKEIKHVIASYRISDLAAVFTTEVEEVTFTTAFSGGIITNDGGSHVSQKGVIWHTSLLMTLDNNSGITIDGDGTDSFISELTDLDPNTTYYVSAYAITEKGISYGVQRSFTTLRAFMPRVNTLDIQHLSHNAARAGGDVTSGGNSLVTQRGVVWSTQPNPTLISNEGFTIDGEGTGVFESEITGLKPETQYYFRSYATNLGGTDYGLEQSFTTMFARIYPNPFSSFIEVEFLNESEKDISIVLFNSRGQEVIRKKISMQGEISEKLNVVHLQSGIYMLTIESEFEFPVWQLIKPGN